MANLGTPLAGPPGDGITAVAFVPDSDDLLVVSSWDGVSCIVQYMSQTRLLPI